jgi:2,4-dienoyl-CoA reductase-like NADH-dependent reductase (Old Yellow Enzyme family)
MNDNSKSILFSKYNINGKLELKNRIAMAPFYIGQKYNSGEFENFYLRRAEGGAGLLIIPIPTFGGFEDLCSDEFIDRWSRFVGKCHSYGCKVIPQVFSGPGEKTNEMSVHELELIPGKFAKASSCIQKTGFDGIEIHGAHHSLFMHLLSPVLNKRKDEYGGSFKNKSDLQIMTVKKIRESAGEEFPVLFRFSATEFIQEGTDLSITRPYAGLLEKAGVDCIHVSAGGTAASPKYSDCPDDKNPEGCFSEFSREIKSEVSIPVMVAGRIASLQTAEMILNGKKADIVSLGRALVADPDWPKKVFDGNEQSVIQMDKWYDVYKSFEK